MRFGRLSYYDLHDLDKENDKWTKVWQMDDRNDSHNNLKKRLNITKKPNKTKEKESSCCKPYLLFETIIPSYLTTITKLAIF